MTDKKLTIGCDLFGQQKLYQVPPWGIKRLRETFPSLMIARIDPSRPQEIVDPDVEVYWGNYLTGEIVDRLPRLRWIHFGSVGVNRALCPEVRKRKICVTNSRTMLVAPVTTTVIGMITALARGFHHCFRLSNEDRLNRNALEDYFDEMHDLQDERCLIVGLGEIGTRVAVVCASLGMKVTAIKKNLTNVPSFIEKVYPLNQLSEAVRDADYIVNLLPLTPETEEIFNYDVFQKMKPSSFFINTGRGRTVKEPDLVEAIEQKTIAGAGLDVFSQEPLPPNSPLWRSRRVILTPHVACLSIHYWPQQIALMEQNIRHYINNQSLIHVVDLNRGY